MTTTPDSPAASQQAAVDAALLVLKSMGLSQYVPVVAATLTGGTLARAWSDLAAWPTDPLRTERPPAA